MKVYPEYPCPHCYRLTSQLVTIRVEGQEVEEVCPACYEEIEIFASGLYGITPAEMVKQMRKWMRKWMPK